MVVWAHNGHIANDTFEGHYEYGAAPEKKVWQ